MSNLWHFFPKGRRLPALERNILKYRAYEMVVILFHVEDLRTYVLGTIRANDKQAIPEGVKKPYEKAWAYLVAKAIITQDESDDIQRLTDYRNTIAHDIQKLTYDLSQETFVVDWGDEAVKYDYKALRRLKKYRPNHTLPDTVTKRGDQLADHPAVMPRPQNGARLFTAVHRAGETGTGLRSSARRRSPRVRDASRGRWYVPAVVRHVRLVIERRVDRSTAESWQRDRAR